MDSQCMKHLWFQDFLSFLCSLCLSQTFSVCHKKSLSMSNPCRTWKNIRDFDHNLSMRFEFVHKRRYCRYRLSGPLTTRYSISSSCFLSCPTCVLYQNNLKVPVSSFTESFLIKVVQERHQVARLVADCGLILESLSVRNKMEISVSSER